MKTRTVLHASLSGLALGALAGCALTGGGSLPDRIVMERGGLIPEGIEFDTNTRRFLTGSLVDGAVYEVGADGSVTPFVRDPDLVSSIGIEADEPRDRLLVANSDRAVIEGQGAGLAALGVYRLSTGERIAMVDLGAVAVAGDGADEDSAVFTNDVTVAPEAPST